MPLDGVEPSTSLYQRDILPLQTMGAYKSGSLTILLLVSLVRLSRIREFKQPSNRVRCHIANLNYARLQGTQSYRLSQNWQPLMDSNHRMSESKSDALDRTWRRSYFILAPIFVILT